MYDLETRYNVACFHFQRLRTLSDVANTPEFSKSTSLSLQIDLGVLRNENTDELRNEFCLAIADVLSIFETLYIAARWDSVRDIGEDLEGDFVP